MTFPPLDPGPCRVVRFADRHLTERYVGWLNDPAVVRYSEQRHSRHTLWSRRNCCKRRERCRRNRGWSCACTQSNRLRMSPEW